MEFRIVLQNGCRIWEQTVLLLPTNCKASILSLMGVTNPEATIRLTSILPNHINISRSRCTEQLVIEMRNMGTLFLKMIHTLLSVSVVIKQAPAKEILIAATFKPHLIRLFFFKSHQINISTNSLRSSTLLNHVDISLGRSSITRTEAAFSIVEEHLSITHDDDIVQTVYRAV